MILFLLLSLTAAAASAEPKLDQLKIDPGFKISLYAYPVKDARSMAMGPDGIVFVGTKSEGSVYALMPDKNGDGKSDAIIPVAKNLNSPNGVAFKGGDLFVAEIDRILRFKNIAKNLRAAKPETWGPSFPDKAHHGWKYIAFGPDGWLYVPVGAPCNICLEKPDLFAAIHRISPDGKKRELVASGVRNTVGFDWSPSDKSLWFTDNGRDWMGDDLPPCELNRVAKNGKNYGFPYCHGTGVLDPEFGKGKNCKDYVPPKHEFPAHSAPLGMKFITKNPALKGSILVAEHGSWNRSTPIGYQVTKIQINGDKAVKASPFLSGFLKGSSAWGRPVDILEMEDGSILISDDEAGAIYRASL